MATLIIEIQGLMSFNEETISYKETRPAFMIPKSSLFGIINACSNSKFKEICSNVSMAIREEWIEYKYADFRTGRTFYMSANGEYLDKVTTIQTINYKRARYLALLESSDDNINKIIDYLENPTVYDVGLGRRYCIPEKLNPVKDYKNWLNVPILEVIKTYPFESDSTLLFESDYTLGKPSNYISIELRNDVPIYVVDGIQINESRLVYVGEINGKVSASPPIDEELQGVKWEYNYIKKDLRREIDNHECSVRGCCKPIKEIHHIDYSNYDDPPIENLRGLCKWHHDICTSIEYENSYSSIRMNPDNPEDLKKILATERRWNNANRS